MLSTARLPVATAGQTISYAMQENSETSVRGRQKPGSGLTSSPASVPAVFVGRQMELKLLRSAQQATEQGRPMMAVVSGPSGIGKTALVKDFIDEIKGRGVTVISGTCRERAASGYSAAETLMSDIIDLLAALPKSESDTLLPRNSEDLGVLFPRLRERLAKVALVGTRKINYHAGVARDRAIAAFVELLRAIRQRGPLVLCLDDMQWGDSDSRQLLGPAIGGLNPVALLLLCCCRKGENRGPLFEGLATDPCVRLPDTFELTLNPLDSETAIELASRLLPPSSHGRTEVARAIGRDAGGHPLFISELCRAASHIQGKLRPATNLAQLVAQRVKRLSESAKNLLEASAVLGSPTRRSVLAGACDLGEAETEEALSELSAAHLIRSESMAPQAVVDTYHDRIRDIVVHDLGDRRHRALHSQLAKRLSLNSTTESEVLAFHCSAAGDEVRAARHWLTAADQAVAALAFDRAAQLYSEGLQALPVGAELAWSVRKRHGLALALAGRGKEAADEYLAAAQHAPEDDALELTFLAADQLLFAGYVDGGLALIEGVRNLLGIPNTSGGQLAVLSLLAGRLRLKRRGFAHVTRSEAELSRSEKIRLDASWSIACALGALDPIRGAEFQTKHLMSVLDAGEPTRVLRAITIECCYQAFAGVRTERQTRRVLDMADELANKQSDPMALGLLRMIHGLAACLQGRLRPALGELSTAESLLEARGPDATWELISIRRFTISSLYFLGEWRRLDAFVKPLLETSLGSGNRYALMAYRTVYGMGGWIARDNILEARRQLRLARETWVSSTYQLAQSNTLMSESLLDLYEGKPEIALSRFESHWPRMSRARLLRVGMIQVQMFQLHAGILIARAQKLPPEESGQALMMRQKARQFARRLASERRLERATPFAALLHAALDLSESAQDSAMEHLKAAAREFDALDMKIWAAVTRAAWSHYLPAAQGLPLRNSASAVFAEEGIVRPDLVIQMFAPGLANDF